MLGAGYGAVPSSTPQSQSAGGVTVKVAYVNWKSNEEPRFHVVLDTHSVDLDSYDLKGLTFMRDENGKAYDLTAAENKGGGHHREIVLLFAKPDAGVKRLELVIKDVAGIKERVFRWNLD